MLRAKQLLLTLVPWIITSSARAQEGVALDLGDGIKLDLVFIKKGSFQQGSPATEPGRNADETGRQVTLTRDFYLGKFPVTRGQFGSFVRATGYRTEAESGPSGGYGFDGKGLVQRKEFTWRNPGFPQTDDHPVTLVTYKDAQAFLAWLAKKTGRAFDLPAEAQWEYACRAGTTTRFYSGASEDDARAIAWYKANAGKGTHPVGQKKPNAFGLFDMNGNVWQWCRDWYAPYEAGPVNDPQRDQPEGKETPRRVLRGGSWLREVAQCRAAARYRNAPGSRNADNGFRVMSLELEKKEGVRGDQAAPVLRRASAGLPLVAAVSDFMLFCPLFVVAGVAALIIIVVLKNLGRMGAGTPYRGDTRRRVRTVDDGFWFDPYYYPPGSLIHYRYWSGGIQRTGSTRVTQGPKGTFVYTGEVPSQVEVLDVVPPAQGVDYESNLGAQIPPQPRDEPALPPPMEPFAAEPSPPPAY